MTCDNRTHKWYRNTSINVDFFYWNGECQGHCGPTTWPMIRVPGKLVSENITCSTMMIRSRPTSTFRRSSSIQIANVSVSMSYRRFVSRCIDQQFLLLIWNYFLRLCGTQLPLALGPFLALNNYSFHIWKDKWDCFFFESLVFNGNIASSRLIYLLMKMTSVETTIARQVILYCIY